LADDLRAFGYTLDNPSGGAKDPLGDFLTRTRAGHCEYFAHALASALRHRGVASRVVVGYRLGAWIEGGGYWLVTQREAHGWVEYVDPDRGEWVTVDPTPAAPAGRRGRPTLPERLGHMMDAARFRWDRHVVRFSGAEQRAGLAWARARAYGMGPALRGTGKREAAAFAALAAAAATIFALWAKRDRLGRILRPSGALGPPGAVPALRPLIRASGVPPLGGETMRSWAARLGELRPDRRARLARLADLAEDAVYGCAPDGPRRAADVARRAADEARAWKRKAKRGAP
jgi:hypothetical protein